MRYCTASALFFVAALGVLPRMGLAQSGDPVATFRQAIDARNKGDITAMMAVFTEDAAREDGSCQPPCVGLPAVRASFQKNIDEHFQAKVTSVEGKGDVVTARAEISSDAFRAQGIDKRVTSYTVKLRDGKIASWTSPLPPKAPEK
jgi:ketosteroid isomerase-like protein